MNFNQTKFIGLFIVMVIALVFSSTPFQSYASLPTEVRLFAGHQKQLDFALPVSAQLTLNDPQIVQVNGQHKPSYSLRLNEPISLSSVHSGHVEMNFKLFGTIPFKKLKVNVVPDLRLIPGGQTIGVKLKSSGILVVGHHLVTASDETKLSPGELAQIQMGDLITEINGERIDDVTKVAPFVKEAGEKQQELNLTLERNGQVIKTKLLPVLDKTDQAYRLGLYIRDSAAGVGTLTFYAPDQGVYGALGHVITDLDTRTPIKVGSGEIVHSTVTSIAKGQSGTPGEKRAHFFKEDKVLGDIRNNTDFGIFGQMRELPEYGKVNEAIPVAFAEEVQEGRAQIYTVVEGNKVESYDIAITHVATQQERATKGLIIKITDPRLIDKTGGIVQGMSGSPIIQNGKIVGAVTHVFVNDPTSGYGCFIEWMLQDAGIMLRENEQTNPKAS